MTAGTNLVGRIWRFTESEHDDEIGGSQPSGTVLYDNVRLQIQALKPTQVLQEQGLNTPTLFNVKAWPGNLLLEENDQVEVLLPVSSLYYGKRFRILGIQATSQHAHNSQNYLLLNLRRDEKQIQNIYQ